MSQILEPSQVGQFDVQRIDVEPSVGAGNEDRNPNQHDEDVVGENEVIHDGEEEERKESEGNEGGK